MRKGGKVSRKGRKPKPKPKPKARKITTTKQTATGKNISQFRGTGAQVNVNIKNPISRARDQLNQAQSAGLSSVLPTILASQQASEGRMETLMRQRDTVQQHMQHAQAQRANAVATGHALAAEDAERVRVRRAAENRALESQQRKLQEDILQVQQPATETRELAGQRVVSPTERPPVPKPQLSAEALRQKRIRALGSSMLTSASEGLTSDAVSTKPLTKRKGGLFSPSSSGTEGSRSPSALDEQVFASKMGRGVRKAIEKSYGGQTKLPEKYKTDPAWYTGQHAQLLEGRVGRLAPGRLAPFEPPTGALVLGSGGVPRPTAPSRSDLQKRMRKETTEELRTKLVAHKEALGGRLAPSQRRIRENRVSRIEAEIKKRGQK